jgi:3-phosphoshikimate 1-carboxyvinyltransferase
MSERRVAPGVIDGVVRAPPSKSYTHRALVIGAHTGRRYRVRHPLVSDDTLATVGGLRALGHPIRISPDSWTLEAGGDPRPVRRRNVDCHESGSTLRFLTPMAALRPVTTRFIGRASLARRPMEGLLQVLERLGAHVQFGARSSGLPVEVTGPIRAGSVAVESRRTSQYLSGLLMTLPMVTGFSELRAASRIVSRPYLDATLEILRHHGVYWAEKDHAFSIHGPLRCVGSSFAVPGDVSSAAYLWAGAAVSGGRVRTTGLDLRWPQADLRCLEALEQAGAHVVRTRHSVRVEGPLTSSFEIDLTEAPDLLPLLAVVASTLSGRSRLLGAEHTIWKETDRRTMTERMVRAFGARTSVTANRFEVAGRAEQRVHRLPPLPDHRLVMAAAIGALAAPRPMWVGPAESVAKSFPDFWSTLKELGAPSELRP